MRTLLNTLYVTTPEAYLSKDGLNAVVSIKQEEVFRIPIHNIEGIVTFGYMGASPGLMKLCVDNNVSLTFMSPQGKFIGRLQGGVHGNVILRKTQYKNADDKDFSLHISRNFIAGKIHNYRAILRRFIRDYGDNAAILDVCNHLERSKREALRASTPDGLRGVEGDAANKYFDVMSNLIIQQKSDFPFNGRSKRPPKDPVNALLSFAYTFIASEVAAALESVGLDPYVGFLHTLRPGRASLALDLMEEMRAYLGDRFVLSLINRRQITSHDFISQSEKDYILNDSGRKLFISAWQKRKKETIIHPYLNEKIPISLLPYTQAMLLARYLRNDIDDYPVFLIK